MSFFDNKYFSKKRNDFLANPIETKGLSVTHKSQRLGRTTLNDVHKQFQDLLREGIV